MSSSSKFINGTGADDQLQGTTGADVIKANAGNDVVYGLAGNDTIDGGVGNDALDGGAGDDVLTGGKGADVFDFSSSVMLWALPPPGVTEAEVNFLMGHDVVTDFELGTDHLRLVFGGNVEPLGTLEISLKITQADVDGDGVTDSVIDFDFTDDFGIHWTDSTSSITLLGVSGATIAQLFATA